MAHQLALPTPCTHGGRRAGAGRKRTAPRPNVPHRARPVHLLRHPVHVTLRLRAGLPSARSYRLFKPLERALHHSSREHFRVVNFSVQSTHVHLIVEADDRIALARGLQGLCIRAARAANHALGRRGALFGDRYHSRDLATPREVHNAIAYVLRNLQHHEPWKRGVDPCSSGTEPLAPPRTWLAREGWRRWGPILLAG
jgi:REP-associated tyrosine transposase